MFISVLQDYRPFALDTVEAAHDRHSFCGNDECDRCISAAMGILRNYHFPTGHCDKRVMPGFVYLASDGEIFKIGASATPSLRIKSLRTSTKRDLKLIHAIGTPDKYASEHYWHHHFIFHAIGGEMFELPPEAVDEFCACASMDVAA